MSTTAPSKWREQYDRMKRWRARLDESGEAEERRGDDFYAFFVCCYHLADWIKHDASVSEEARAAASDFRNVGALALAGDVTNSFKHLERDRKPKADRGVHVSVLGRFSVGNLDDVAADQTWTDEYVVVVAGDQTWEDAYAVADCCIVQWEGFLRRHRLM